MDKVNAELLHTVVQEATTREQAAAAVPSSEKPHLSCLARHNTKTPEGKYLILRRDGTIPAWPSFVLGAKDRHAVAALHAYADSIAQDPDCHPDLPASIRRLANEFARYREQHGDSDPTRGLHRVDDPVIVALMRLGGSA